MSIIPHFLHLLIVGILMGNIKSGLVLNACSMRWKKEGKIYKNLCDEKSASCKKKPSCVTLTMLWKLLVLETFRNFTLCRNFCMVTQFGASQMGFFLLDHIEISPLSGIRWDSFVQLWRSFWCKDPNFQSWWHRRKLVGSSGALDLDPSVLGWLFRLLSRSTQEAGRWINRRSMQHLGRCLHRTSPRLIHQDSQRFRRRSIRWADRFHLHSLGDSCPNSLLQPGGALVLGVLNIKYLWVWN